ncbi:hypothetical protein CVT25_008779 [Psilocybe cyanescens]|uniref:BRCT domain-containing protein n=1 Tax=Psilocybe cyanescens TaxID=93625 RepID=A0A409XN40_PSICY|nr:hypothetical protein CVT25_008779 [Psilocybe cyanescens]
MSLFATTVYHISPSLPPTLIANLDALLQANGGTRAIPHPLPGSSPSSPSHPAAKDTPAQDAKAPAPSPTKDPALAIVVSDSLRFPGWEDIALRRAQEAGSGVPDAVTGEERRSVDVVTPRWVERSVVLGKLQHPSHYSADPAALFSGIVASATASLPPADTLTLSAGIPALGGQWRAALTREVTHLFALHADSAEYATAMHFKPDTGVKVLLPHWFDDSVRMGVRGLEEAGYEWPDPRVLRVGPDALLGSQKDKNKEKQKQKAGSGLTSSQDEHPTEIDEEKARIKRNLYITAARFTPAMGRAAPPSDADLALVLGAPPASSNANVNVDADTSGMLVVPASSLLPALTASTANPAQPTTTAIATNNNVNINVWQGRRILLSRTLQLTGARRASVQAGIERAGGVVVRYEGDGDEGDGEEQEAAHAQEDQQGKEGAGGGEKEKEKVGTGEGEKNAAGQQKEQENATDAGARTPTRTLSRQERRRRRREAEKVPECDVLVTRWREGRGYVQAVRTHKLIGTLAWLFHVQACGVLSHPMNQLLHYPVPKRRIEGFYHHVITVTNYTGEAREYIKKLVFAMGATFTPSMSGQNTVLVAAYTSGTKAAKAASWSIPIVNHTWLEDCFIAWRNLTPAHAKYILFAPGDDWSRRLGERGVSVGVRNGISGGWGGVARVGKSREEGDVAVIEEEEEERELGRIEQEAEELAEEWDELGNSEDDEAEEARERQRAQEKEQEQEQQQQREGAGAEAGMELQPPNGTAESMEQVVDDLVGGDMDMDVDMEEEVQASTPSKNPKSTSKETPKSASKDKTKGKGKERVGGGPSASSPVKPTYVPASKKSKAKTNGKKKGVVSDDEVEGGVEEEESGGEEKDVEEDEMPANVKAKAKSDSKLKPKQKATSTTAKSKSKPMPEPESVTESESEPEKDVEYQEDEDLPVPVKKTTAKTKSRREQPPASSSGESEVEGAMDVDTDADLPPAPRSPTKSMSKSKSKEGKAKGSKQATNGKASKRVQSSDDEAAEEPPVPATKKKPLARRLTVELEKRADQTPAKHAPAPATPAAPTPAPVVQVSATTSTPGGGLLNRVKGDARTRIRKKKPGQEKKRDVYVESESEPEVAVPDVVVAQKDIAKAKGKGKAKAKESDKPPPKANAKVAAKTGKSKKSKTALSEEEEEEEEERIVESEDDEEEVAVVRSSKADSKSKAKDKGKGKAAEKAPAKTRGKKAAVSSEEEHEEEHADTEEEEEEAPPPKKRAKKPSTPPPPPPPPKARSKPLRVYSTAEEDVDDDVEEEEEDSDDGLPVNPFMLSKAEQRAKEKEKEKATAKSKASKSKSTPAAKSKSAKSTTNAAATLTNGKSKAKPTAKKAATPSDTEPEVDEEEEEEEPPRRKGAKGGPSPPKRVLSVLMPSLDLSPSRGKTGKGKEKESSSVVVKGKGKGKKVVEMSSEEEEEEERPAAKPPKAKASAKAKSSSKPKKTTAPPPREPASSENESEEEDEVSLLVSPRTSRALVRTESIRAVAGQASASAATPSRSAAAASTSISAAMKGKKSKTATSANVNISATASTSKAISTSTKSKPKTTTAVPPAPEPMDVDVDSISMSTVGPSMTLPRRNAAAEATQRLHETIMPDLVHYESQVKKARRASSHANSAFALADEMDVRVNGVSEKRKKVVEDDEDESAGGASAEGGGKTKRRRISDVAGTGPTKKGKSKVGASAGDDDDMDVDQSLPGHGIVIMTTQVTLADDVVRALSKLGIKTTARASECTHLLAPHVVRTEKFLCALASRAPWVLQDKWAIDSAKAKKVLPEKDFILKDKSGENKYGVNLVQALKRAKDFIENGGLLAGHTFYLTPKVPVDAKLLKNVVVACGGQVTSQTPTLRIINAAPSTRHVISCKEDIAIWRPLTSSRTVNIYTQELILTGVLKQEMEWDKEEYFVQGSY